MKENAKKVNSTSIKSQMPVLLMVSNGKGTGFSQEQWRHCAISFAKRQKNMEVTYYEEFIQETTD
ncbi:MULTISPECIES: hypothetical protein [Streptococcus]|uniref:hypothetical protein n=1 Tax=Streptococcus TaxID=1301 RepID=UPI001E616C4C|nr:hypothetical protein [Streptococcus thermophilus]